MPHAGADGGAKTRNVLVASSSKHLLRALPFNLTLLAGTGGIAWATMQADEWLGLPSLIHIVGHIIGFLSIAAGLWLRISATAVYYRHEMAVVRLLPQHSLVTVSPFAHVRNPLLQGWWLLQLGWAVALGTPMGLLLTLVLGLVLNAWVGWEELTLTTEFGDDYVDYNARAPRWGWRR